MWQLVKKVIFSLIIGLILLNSQANCLDWKFAVTTATDIRFFYANWTYTNHRISNDNHMREISVFTYDTISDTLYFANNNYTTNQGQIYELKKFDNETHPPPNLLIALNTTIRGLVFDSIDNNLYWSDRSRIIRFNINTKKSELFLNKNGTFPTDITLDLCERQLYYVNQHEPSTSIEQINLDNKTINIIAKGLSRTHSITVDYYSKKLYWMDDMGRTNVRIEAANFNGSERHVVFKRQSDNPVHLITDQDNIYYSSTTYKRVVRIGKLDSNRTIIDYNGFGPEGPIDILMKHTSDEFNYYTCKGIIEKLNSTNFIKMDIAQPIPICKSSAILNAEINECKTDSCYNFCLNGGTCSINNEQITKCDCPPGFSGNRCEMNKCHKFCMNDMKCNINNNGDPVCMCEKNKFSGDRCEEDVKVELCKNRCLNNGTCSFNNKGLPVCHCSSLYTGDRCQLNVCPASYCLNNGMCVVEGDKPVCIFMLEYKDHRCKIENQNTTNYDNYCLNGGVLEFNDGIATCKCPETVSGARCQETLCANYCLNNGICNVIDGEPTCKCAEGVRGDRCQVELTFQEIYNKSCNGDIAIANLYKINVTEVCFIPPNQKECSCTPSSIIVVTIGVVVALLLLLSIVVVLRMVYKPLRPKVKKTYVVRKNFTPLTSRPGGGGTECEITIEDCCNMNICETPCFDPKILQGCDSSSESPIGRKSEQKRKEDKRKLLDLDFGNGGELY